MTDYLNKISQAIAKSGLTITDISKKLSLSRNSFYQKLRGEHKFTVDEIRILAEITEKPISFFIEENEFEIKNFSTEQIPVYKVPVISWVSANHFGEASNPFPPGIADEWVYSTA
jgi:transcriptional regulator with XRE-family HTH domain